MGVLAKSELVFGCLAVVVVAVMMLMGWWRSSRFRWLCSALGAFWTLWDSSFTELLGSGE
jgi:high-affinity Fe2+/Pb2+ permease